METTSRTNMAAPGQTRRGLFGGVGRLGGAGLLAGGALAWLSGCGTGQGAPGTGGAKLAGKVDLIYVSDPGEQELHERWAARFHDLNPNVTVGLTLLKEDSEYVPKLVSLVAGGTAPDASYVHPSMLPGLASKGALVSVENYVAKDKSSHV